MGTGRQSRLSAAPFASTCHIAHQLLCTNTIFLYTERMHEIPELFMETSLKALPDEERQAFFEALTHGAHCRGLRLRPGVAIGTVRLAVPDKYDPIPWARGAYYIDPDSLAGAHPLHAAGAYYLQEPSAMAAVAALDVRPGQRVLDLCAAPGGKSTQIGGLLAGRGLLATNEIVPSRARILSQNVERLGIRNAVVTNETPDRLAARWGVAFDRVLVDAPCSGEGMFRREASARAEWTPQSPQGCAVRQMQILQSAADMLRPGGLLVYSTCTFNTIENEGVVEAFLQTHPEFAAEDFTLEGIGASQNGCLRLWPHKLRGEGHFVARLRRAGEDGSPSAQEAQSVSLRTYLDAFGAAQTAGNPTWSGDKLWVVPEGMPDLTGIRVLRNGLAIGERRGKVFVPDHALAMAFSPDTFAQSLPVDDEAARRYLRGETLPAEGCTNGWTVVTFMGMSLGWGKCVEGTLKNHLPKGLRWMQ